MYYLPTSLILIGYSIVTLMYIFKNRKTKLESQLFANEIIIALLFLAAGIMFPFMYQFHSPNLGQEILDNMWIVTSTIFLIEMGIWVIMLSYNALLSKRNPEIMAKRDYQKFCDEFKRNWVDDLKSEFGRKFLHLFTCFVIFFCWSLAVILNDFEILTQFGLDIYSFAYWLIIIIGFGFVIMFQIGDLSRLTKFYILPNWAKKLYKNMRKEELNTFIASTPLVLSFIPFLFAPFPIFATVALITTGADAAACLIGKKFGTHRLKKNSDKTIEGFLAGGITTFLIVIIIPQLYYRWMAIDLEKIILMAIVASILFLLVDAYAKYISDNILNPLLTGFAMWIILLI